MVIILSIDLMEKYITLVFDDGPNDFLTKMVDKIKSYGFTAAFAIIGKKVNDDTKEALKYAIDNGFELVSHGQNHINLTLENTTKEDMIYELTEPIKNVKKYLGYNIKLARLPFISYNDAVLETSKELELPLLGSGMGGGRDWADDTTVKIIVDAIMRSANDGAIACLHVREKTLAALDEVLPELKKQGYILTTPQELFAIKGIKNIPLGINIDNANDFI